jgi:hypothetical protein
MVQLMCVIRGYGSRRGPKEHTSCLRTGITIGKAQSIRWTCVAANVTFVRPKFKKVRTGANHLHMSTRALSRGSASLA